MQSGNYPGRPFKWSSLSTWYFREEDPSLSAVLTRSVWKDWLLANKSEEFVRLPLNKVFLQSESEHFPRHHWQSTDSSAWAVYEAHSASAEWKLLQGHIHSIKAWPWHPWRTSKYSQVASAPVASSLSLSRATALSVARGSHLFALWMLKNKQLLMKLNN